MKAAYITPAITTLRADRTLDLDAQGRLFDHLIRGGVDGILILGSIGEFFALDLPTRHRLIRFSIRHIAGRVPLWVGTGGMQATATIDLSNEVLKAGADAVVVISPYYFALDDASIERYYDRIAENVNGPVCLYNFPDRTGYDLSPAVTLRLLDKHPNIFGYKDTLAGFDHTRRLIRTIKPHYPRFRIFCGFDDHFARTVLSGGDGCIGGLSNLLPGLCARWVYAFAQNDLATVSSVQQTIDRLMAIYSVGQPFVPFIKEAVRLCGVQLDPVSTFPLPTPTDAQRDAIADILRASGML